MCVRRIHRWVTAGDRGDLRAQGHRYLIMWVKVILLLLFGVMILGAVHFAQPRESAVQSSSGHTRSSLRLLTWNIGYAELEDDTRAHDKDLPAVADVIRREDPDAVALQELTDKSQLNIL